MAQKNARRTSRAGIAGKLPKNVLRAGLALLLILAAAVTISVENGGAIPTWEQLYDFFGLSAPGPHLPADAAESATKVHFIDVGQGDATLLEQDGLFALVDTGEASQAETLIAYLQQAGVERLSLLVMTHPHTDHMGGMRKVLQTFPVDTLLLPDLTKAPMPTNSTFTRLLETVRKEKIHTVTARVGDVFPLGSASLTVLGNGVETENLNDLSLVTMFEAPGLRFFSSGDGEKPVEQALLDSGADVHADLYKAAHHGSSTSNTAALLEAVRPSAIVISCGKDNDYGHPHRETMETFGASGAAIYRTDENGTVIAYVDGYGRMQIAVSRQEAA